MFKFIFYVILFVQIPIFCMEPKEDLPSFYTSWIRNPEFALSRHTSSGGVVFNGLLYNGNHLDAVRNSDGYQHVQEVDGNGNIIEKFDPSCFDQINAMYEYCNPWWTEHYVPD